MMPPAIPSAGTPPMVFGSLAGQELLPLVFLLTVAMPVLTFAGLVFCLYYGRLSRWLFLSTIGFFIWWSATIAGWIIALNSRAANHHLVGIDLVVTEMETVGLLVGGSLVLLGLWKTTARVEEKAAARRLKSRMNVVAHGEKFGTGDSQHIQR